MNCADGSTKWPKYFNREMSMLSAVVGTCRVEGQVDELSVKFAIHVFNPYCYSSYYWQHCSLRLRIRQNNKKMANCHSFLLNWLRMSCKIAIYLSYISTDFNSYTFSVFCTRSRKRKGINPCENNRIAENLFEKFSFWIQFCIRINVYQNNSFLNIV